VKIKTLEQQFHIGKKMFTEFNKCTFDAIQKISNLCPKNKILLDKVSTFQHLKNSNNPYVFRSYQLALETHLKKDVESFSLLDLNAVKDTFIKDLEKDGEEIDEKALFEILKQWLDAYKICQKQLDALPTDSIKTKTCESKNETLQSVTEEKEKEKKTTNDKFPSMSEMLDDYFKSDEYQKKCELDIAKYQNDFTNSLQVEMTKLASANESVLNAWYNGLFLNSSEEINSENKNQATKTPDSESSFVAFQKMIEPLVTKTHVKFLKFLDETTPWANSKLKQLGLKYISEELQKPALQKVIALLLHKNLKIESQDDILDITMKFANEQIKLLLEFKNWDFKTSGEKHSILEKTFKLLFLSGEPEWKQKLNDAWHLPQCVYDWNFTIEGRQFLSMAMAIFFPVAADRNLWTPGHIVFSLQFLSQLVQLFAPPPFSSSSLASESEQKLSLKMDEIQIAKFNLLLQEKALLFDSKLDFKPIAKE
jgi:hypothetical protein